MVQMHGKDRLGENFVGAADQTLKEPFIRIRTSAFTDLNNERGLRLQVTTE